MTSRDDLPAALHEVLVPMFRRLDSTRSLSIGKMGMLSRLDAHGPASASDLAQVLRISPQAVTIAVRELEAGALVARTPDPADRRRVWIDVTEAGRERLARERAIGGAWLAEAIAERLDDAQRDTLVRALPVLAAITEDRDA